MNTHSPFIDCAVGLHAFRTAMPIGGLRYVFDLSQFRDPIGQGSLRYSNGLNTEVQAFIRVDPKTVGVIQIARILAHDTLVVGTDKYLAIGFKDFHGSLISSAMAEIIAGVLEEDRFVVGVTHHAIN